MERMLKCLKIEQVCFIIKYVCIKVNENKMFTDGESPLTPSWVSFNPSTENISVGKPAVEQGLTNIANTIFGNIYCILN